MEVSKGDKFLRHNIQAVGLFRERREMCEENKRPKKKKKKTKALQQESKSSPKKTRPHAHKTWLSSWAKAPREKGGWKSTL